MAITQNFSIPIGDAVSIPFSLTNADGTPYDYTGHVLKLFVSQAPLDGGVYLFSKGTDDGGISVVSAVGGTGNINFLAADRALITSGPGSYPFALRDETAQLTLTIGQVTFLDHAGR